jgi:hypothetical protein
LKAKKPTIEMVGFSLTTSTTPLSSLDWTGGFASPGCPWVCLFGEEIRFETLLYQEPCQIAKPFKNQLIA